MLSPASQPRALRVPPPAPAGAAREAHRLDLGARLSVLLLPALCAAPAGAQPPPACGRFYALPPAEGYRLREGEALEVTLYLETLPAGEVQIPALGVALSFDPERLQLEPESSPGDHFRETILEPLLERDVELTLVHDNQRGAVGLLMACLSCILSGEGGAAGGTDRAFLKLRFRAVAGAGGPAWVRFEDADGQFPELNGTVVTELYASRGGFPERCGRAGGGLLTEDVEITLEPRGGGFFVRGDASPDGAVNLSDAVFVLSHLFRGGPVPGCLDAADANDDGQVNLSDAVSVLNHLFRAGGDLPPPAAGCGADPTPGDGLECREHRPCRSRDEDERRARTRREGER